MRLTPMRLFWGLLALVISMVSFGTVSPGLFNLTATYALVTPFAQIVAMRGWLVVGFGVAGILFLIVAGIRGLVFRRGRIALTFSLTTFLVAGMHAAIMYSRGINETSDATSEVAFSDSTDGITVLQYNTLGGSVDVSVLAGLIENKGVTVVSLPETSTRTGEDLVDDLADRGLWFQQFDTGTSGYEAGYKSTILLISSSLGEYVQTDVFDSAEEPLPPAVRAVPADGDGPAFIAIHPVAPRPDRMDTWQREIRAAYGLCGTETNTIIAGDFNSTVDHEAALRLDTSCTDAAVQAGAGALGTWPARLPKLLSSPIDRVLTTTDEYRGSEATTVNLGGSDHRGVVVRLVRGA